MTVKGVKLRDDKKATINLNSVNQTLRLSSETLKFTEEKNCGTTYEESDMSSSLGQITQRNSGEYLSNFKFHPVLKTRPLVR